MLVCATCGVEREERPQVCPICDDERQFLPSDGVQRWVDPAAVDVSIGVAELEPGLWGISLAGAPGIGQQAKIIQTDKGNVMVEVPTVINKDVVDAVRQLGNVNAIVPSHPHMFGCQSLWSDSLGAPVYVAKADAEWLGVRPDGAKYWEGTLEVVPGVIASSPGGHFPGSAVVHWAARDGKGVLVAGDTVMANPDHRSVSFMRSYPNRIPLSAKVVARVADHVARYDFDRLYNNFVDYVPSNAKDVVMRSAQRHIEWVNGVHDDLT